VEPLALNSDKTFTVDHAYSYIGHYAATVHVIDGNGGSEILSLPVEIIDRRR
jgi:hypothetical protein